MSFDPESLPYINPKRDRRVALIINGNSGVGWFTVLNLYLHGYVIYLAGRSKSRYIKSMDDLENEAAFITAQYSPTEEASRWVGELHYLEMDLASLASVSGAAANFKNTEKNLNLLINNAAVCMSPYVITSDGFELQLQTNFIAPFLLTLQLVPLMEKTADLFSHAGPPRIIWVSSVSHRLVPRYINLNRQFNYAPNFAFTWFRYAIAKAAGIHAVKMLALRNPRLICTSVQPGIVMNTNYFAYWTRLPIIGSVFWCLFHLFAFLFGVTVNEGALAIFKCCLDPTVPTVKNNGCHYNMLQESQPSKVSRNMDYAAQTWIWTTHQLGKRNFSVD